MIKKLINNIILIFLIAILILVSYSKYVKKDEVVRIGKYAVLVVLTQSMEPAIEPEEILLIKKCDEYEIGDIVTYVNLDRILITHRIVQIDEYSFIAKGDNNKITDENSKIEAIQGKVIFHSKILGIFVLHYLKMVIIAYLIIVVIMYLRKMVIKEKPNEKEK